jgi:hypothetical protein
MQLRKSEKRSSIAIPNMNPSKPRSKVISKYVDVIFYGRCNFEVLIVKPIKLK